MSIPPREMTTSAGSGPKSHEVIVSRFHWLSGPAGPDGSDGSEPADVAAAIDPASSARCAPTCRSSWPRSRPSACTWPLESTRRKFMRR